MRRRSRTCLRYRPLPKTLQTVLSPWSLPRASRPWCPPWSSTCWRGGCFACRRGCWSGCCSTRAPAAAAAQVAQRVPELAARARVARRPIEVASAVLPVPRPSSTGTPTSRRCRRRRCCPFCVRAAQACRRLFQLLFQRADALRNRARQRELALADSFQHLMEISFNSYWRGKFTPITGKTQGPAATVDNFGACVASYPQISVRGLCGVACCLVFVA